MQYTRNTTMTKTDRDTLRSLHGRKKWEHIWAYYKLPIAIVLIVVYILVRIIERHGVTYVTQLRFVVSAKHIFIGRLKISGSVVPILLGEYGSVIVVATTEGYTQQCGVCKCVYHCFHYMSVFIYRLDN